MPIFKGNHRFFQMVDFEKLKQLSSILSNEEGRKILQHPKLQALLANQELSKAIKDQNIFKILSHPEFQKLTQDPEFKELMAAFKKICDSSKSKDD